MPDQVAVFIDVENFRYGLINNYGIEPDFQTVVQEAQKYGRPSLMRAYADFAEHPPLRYWSLRIIDEWYQDPRQELPGTAKERRDAISALKGEGVLVQQERKDEKTGRTVTEAILDEVQARKSGYLK